MFHLTPLNWINGLLSSPRRLGNHLCLLVLFDGVIVSRDTEKSTGPICTKLGQGMGQGQGKKSIRLWDRSGSFRIYTYFCICVNITCKI